MADTNTVNMQSPESLLEETGKKTGATAAVKKHHSVRTGSRCRRVLAHIEATGIGRRSDLGLLHQDTYRSETSTEYGYAYSKPLHSFNRTRSNRRARTPAGAFNQDGQAWNEMAVGNE